MKREPVLVITSKFEIHIPNQSSTKFLISKCGSTYQQVSLLGIWKNSPLHSAERTANTALNNILIFSKLQSYDKLLSTNHST